MGNPFVRSGLSFSFPTSIFPPLKPPLHETLLTRIPIGFPKHRRTLPPHSSSSSSNFDIISTTESWDGSLLFRFGDESEKSVTTETATDAQSHLEDPVQDSKLSQTLLGRRGSGGGGGAAAEADETVDAHSATTTDSATGGGGEETTTTRSITTITTITTEDETQLSNEIHAFPAIGTAAAEAKENAVDVVSITSTSSATGRGDGGEKTTITTTTTTTADGTEISNEIPVFPSIGGAEAEENAVDAVSLTSTGIATGGGSGGGEETTTRTNETQVSKEIRAFPAIGTAAADAKENVVDAVSVTSTNIATGGGGSGGREETTTTTTITTATITDETQVSDEIHAFPAIGGAEAQENAVDAVSVTSTDIVTGGGSGGGEETTTTTTRTTTTVETQVSNDIHAEGEEYAADAVSATSTTMATGGEETTTTTTTEETQVSNEIHAFPANGGAKAEENAVDAVSVMSTGIATGGGEETTTTTTTTTDETQVSNEIHAFPAIGGAEAEENAVDAVSVTSTNIATGGGSGGGEETTTTITTTTYETQVTNDIHAETEENAVDAVSVTSTSIATGGGRGGAEETTTTTTTTTEETQVSNEIDVFPAISSAGVEENAVDAVSVTSTGIAKGGGSGSGEETTTTTEETQVSNEIDVFPAISSTEAEENAVDAVSVMSTGIAKGDGSGSGEETTTTTTTTTEETQVSNDIHAFPAIGGAKENAVDVVSVTSTSTATGGSSGGGEETRTRTTTTTRTTTDETQFSNEIFAFPAISGVEAEENAVDAVSVASTNIVTGGSSGGGQETITTTTTTTDETQVSNDIHAQAEENAVDAVSVTISNNATSGGGEETTTTITTTATTTTTSDETQVSPVLAENAPSTNPEDEFTEGKADTTDVSGISTYRIVEFNIVEGTSDGEDVSAAVLQLASSAALLPHPSKVGRMLTLLVAKIG